MTSRVRHRQGRSGYCDPESPGSSPGRPTPDRQASAYRQQRYEPGTPWSLRSGSTPAAEQRLALRRCPSRRLPGRSAVALSGGPALPVESFEPVEQDVEGELELELVVAASADDRGLVVGDGHGQLVAVGVPGCHLVERGGLRVGVDSRALRG